jgi:anaerobic selenocysteine-containing dehydrogenase
MCGMCAVRCPIEVTVEDGRVTWLQGNTNDAAIGTSLCAKGAAGLDLEFGDERPQTPLIRVGERGAGQWRRASWDEALDYIVEKLKETIGDFGGRGIALSESRRSLHRPDPDVPAGARVAELLQPRRRLQQQRPQRVALDLRSQHCGPP